MEQVRSDRRPTVPCFSSGPCAKPPGWSPAVLGEAVLGRSHRSAPGRFRLREVIDLTREILAVPDDYRIGIVPASDTGAVEMAMWSLLGERPVDVLVWESFGSDWAWDITSELQIAARILKADYGHLPDLTQVDFAQDVVFAWNGTTSGVAVPDGTFIPQNRSGLTLCDATSAAFVVDLPWERLDVTTFSWQKVLGGEAAHGVLILAPRAVDRLLSYVPAWPIPKIFRLVKDGHLIEGIFAGATINTPSMLCVEDVLHSLCWARDLGGVVALRQRAEANVAVINAFVRRHDWINHLAVDPATRSLTSVCLRVTPPGLDGEQSARVARGIAARLAEAGVAYDIGSYRAAPPGLRIWCGATVETADIEALMPWIEQAYEDAVASACQGAVA